MDNAQGSDFSILQPGDTNVPISLKLKAASASTANDGSMPYGSTLVSSSWVAYDPSGVACTSNIVITSSFSSNINKVFLTYSTALVNGMHKLTCKATVSVVGSSRLMKREFDLKRIMVKNL